MQDFLFFSKIIIVHYTSYQFLLSIDVYNKVFLTRAFICFW